VAWVVGGPVLEGEAGLGSPSTGLGLWDTDSLFVGTSPFSCRRRDQIAQVLMSRIPGARLADDSDVATRFEVLIREGGSDRCTVGVGDGNGAGGGGDVSDISLAHLFHVLASQGDVGKRLSQGQYVLEEDSSPRRRRCRLW
jgi:hypothetical protein